MREDGRAVSEKIVYVVLGVACLAGGCGLFLHVRREAVFPCDRLGEKSGYYRACVSGSALCDNSGDAERLLDQRHHIRKGGGGRSTCEKTFRAAASGDLPCGDGFVSDLLLWNEGNPCAGPDTGRARRGRDGLRGGDCEFTGAAVKDMKAAGRNQDMAQGWVG